MNTEVTPNDSEKLTSETPEASNNITTETGSNSIETPQEAPKKTDPIVQISIKGKQSCKDYIQKTAVELGCTLGEALDYIIKLSQKPAMPVQVDVEKIVEKTVEVIKEVPVPIQLEGTQFICELDNATALNARKCRKFIRDDGKIEMENYPNGLVNHAVKLYLLDNYDHIIE